MVSVGHDTGAAVALLIENYYRLGLRHKHFNFGDALYSGQDIADALAKVRQRALSPGATQKVGC
jgi:nucleoside-diphosphate-sugar epimerase